MRIGSVVSAMEYADVSALGESGDTSARKGYAAVVRDLSPDNTRRPHSKFETLEREA